MMSYLHTKFHDNWISSFRGVAMTSFWDGRTDGLSDPNPRPAFAFGDAGKNREKNQLNLSYLVYTHNIHSVDHSQKYTQYYKSGYTTAQTCRQHRGYKSQRFYYIHFHNLDCISFRNVNHMYRLDTPLHTPPCLFGISPNNHYKRCYRSFHRTLYYSSVNRTQ